MNHCSCLKCFKWSEWEVSVGLMSLGWTRLVDSHCPMCPLGKDDCTRPFSLAPPLVCGHGQGNRGASPPSLSIQNRPFAGSSLSWHRPSPGPAGPSRLPSRYPDWALALPHTGLRGASGGLCGLAKPWALSRSSCDLRSGLWFVPQVEPLLGLGHMASWARRICRGPAPLLNLPSRLDGCPPVLEDVDSLSCLSCGTVLAWQLIKDFN